MKLQRIPNDDIVTVRFGVAHNQIAEAHELKTAGFGQRDVTRDYPGEWTLAARSYRDFKILASAIPPEADAGRNENLPLSPRCQTSFGLSPHD